MLTAMEKNIEEGDITIILMEIVITVKKDITKKPSLNFLFVKVPSFSGDSDPNVYLDWEAKCEKKFNAREVNDD